MGSGRKSIIWHETFKKPSIETVEFVPVVTLWYEVIGLVTFNIKRRVHIIKQSN